MDTRPLGRKAYGSIGHLPGSKLGDGDHVCAPGQARIATEKTRDKHDVVWVEEKLDGSCCAAARVGDQITALTRRGFLASESRFEHHHMWAQWVDANRPRFLAVLSDGERLVGEWLALAHGTRYRIAGDPWVCFDLMIGPKRAILEERDRRVGRGAFIVPPRLCGSRTVDSVEEYFVRWPESVSSHRSIVPLDPFEGAVWRVERKGEVDFLVKYVRPTAQPGRYLPELSGGEAVWNWRPSEREREEAAEHPEDPRPDEPVSPERPPRL